MNSPKVVLVLLSLVLSQADSYGKLVGAFHLTFEPAQEPVLDVPNGGYLCSNQSFVLELNFSNGGPYTFSYSIDGVEQDPITTSDENYVLSVTSAEYQDSVVITGVINMDGQGVITGMPFIKVGEPLSVGVPAISCDDNSQTYFVEFQMAGGAFGYLSVGTTNGFINGDTFTSEPIPFGENYDIQITSGLRCDTVALTGLPDCSVSCPELSIPVISDVEVVPNPCGTDGGSIIVTAGGQNFPLEYSIDDGATFQTGNVFDSLNSGDYSILVRDDNQCEVSAEVTIGPSVDPPVIEEILIEQMACEADKNSISVIAVSSSTSLSYSINGTDFQTGNRFSDLVPGAYSVSVKDNSGCLVTETVVIPSIDPLAIEDLEVNEADCRGNNGTIIISTRGGTGRLIYSLNDTLQQEIAVFEDLPPGNYRLMVTDGSECSISREVTISRGECPLYIANAFSPNGDGVNDEFAIFSASGIHGQVVTYQIFSRWGELVFRSGGFPLGQAGQWWNGTIKGRQVSPGTFIYHLVIELDSGERIVETGEVSVLR